MAPIARSLIRLHHSIKIPADRKLALDLATKVSGLPGLLHFSRATVMPASVNTGRTYFPMKFATEEQAARRKGQMVNVMHRWLHVESYEIFMKEVEVDEDDEGLGEVEKGGAA